MLNAKRHKVACYLGCVVWARELITKNGIAIDEKPNGDSMGKPSCIDITEKVHFTNRPRIRTQNTTSFWILVSNENVNMEFKSL